MRQIIDMAKQYIDMEIPIIPVCSHDHAHTTAKHNEKCKCPGKMPLIANWTDKKETTTSELNNWLASFKTFNIGMPLGDASGFCAIDIDGDEGIKLLQEMSKGDLPATWEFVTGGGHRLFYLIPVGMKTKKFKKSGAGTHEECALLCTGQQTVLPPSIHYTGRRYEWVDEHSPWDLDCAMAPEWLIQAIKLEDGIKPLNNSFNMTMPSMSLPNSGSSEFDLEDEFTQEAEFADDLPPNVELVSRTVKAGKTGKSGHKIVVTDELLTQPIPEGNRDNTMTAIVGHYCANRDLRRLGKDFILNICLQHNTTYCQPPLDEADIKTKVDYFFETELLKDAAFADKAKKPPFEASKMARNVIQYLANGGLSLHFDQFSKIYYYTTNDKGPWHGTRNYALINKWIRDVLTSPHFGDPSWDKKGYIEETRTALEEQFTVPYKTVDDFDLGAHQKELRDFIVVNNGMVDWQNQKLIPWDPSLKTTISFDIDYDPDAECPRFEKYLKDWLPDPSVRLVLQEYLGYCLIPNTNYRKAIFLYGRGKNGKSMLVEFLQDFFGNNSATLSYDGLFTRFGPSGLKDKLVNIYDDTEVSFTKETSMAKNLIAGGSISAEYKGRDAFQFQNMARFIYSSQDTPRTADNSLAWYERWFFIKFPNQFRASNKAKIEIQNALQEEKAGIFNWMIEGLIRLMDQDDFTQSSKLDLATLEYKGQNDNVSQFVQTVCTYNPDEEVKKMPINTLYKIYCVWAENESLRPVSKKVLTQRISDYGYDKAKGYIDGVSQTYFKGLLLDQESEGYKENIFAIKLAIDLK